MFIFLSAQTQQDIVPRRRGHNLTALSVLSYRGTTLLTFHPHWPGLCSCIHFVMFWLVPAGIRPTISHVPSMFSCLCAALLCREIRLREESAERRKLSPSCVSWRSWKVSGAYSRSNRESETHSGWRSDVNSSLRDRLHVLMDILIQPSWRLLQSVCSSVTASSHLSHPTMHFWDSDLPFSTFPPAVLGC